MYSQNNTEIESEIASKKSLASCKQEHEWLCMDYRSYAAVTRRMLL